MEELDIQIEVTEGEMWELEAEVRKPFEYSRCPDTSEIMELAPIIEEIKMLHERLVCLRELREAIESNNK